MLQDEVPGLVYQDKVQEGPLVAGGGDLKKPQKEPPHKVQTAMWAVYLEVRQVYQHNINMYILYSTFTDI